MIRVARRRLRRRGAHSAAAGGTIQMGVARRGKVPFALRKPWRMRCPSIGEVEDLFSARFCLGRSGTQPDGIEPVEGLRMSQGFAHVPVLAGEVVALLGAVPDGLLVDATVGGAGHARRLLDAQPGRRLLGIDQDGDAVAAAAHTLAGYGGRAVVRRARFDELAGLVAAEGLGPVAGVLFDLGVSSHQLDTAARGFSYRTDGPLDMRMDQHRTVTADRVVNEWDEAELARLFAANGEGRFARRIARHIVDRRPITTTGELADVVRDAIPAAARRRGGHPAKRVFQAVRITVNDELSVLSDALDAAIALLVPGGRCLAIAYHSGEDRIVKARFTGATTGGCTCPPRFPCICGATPVAHLVFRGARRPDRSEVAANPRAETARLRAVERLDVAAAGRAEGTPS